MSITSEQLYNECLRKFAVVLNPAQEGEFRYACEKSIKENPSLDLNNLVIAAHIYLKMILDNPTIELGEIQPPA